MTIPRRRRVTVRYTDGEQKVADEQMELPISPTA
jgi:hypothetical protein